MQLHPGVVVGGHDRKRLLTAAAVVLLLAVAAYASVWKTTISESDKADAARSLVAWYVEGEPIPGLNDEKFRRVVSSDSDDQIFLTCDFVPPEVELTKLPRVIRVTNPPLVPGRTSLDSNQDLLKIKLIAESRHELVLGFSSWSSPTSGVNYHFTFRKTLTGPRVTGQMFGKS